MANQDAWQSGWDKGTATANKNKKKTDDTGDKDEKKKSSKKGSGSSSSGNPWSILNYIPKLHNGGKVKKTGNYRLRKKEVVLTATQAKAAGIKGAQGKKKTGARKRVSGKA